MTTMANRNSDLPKVTTLSNNNEQLSGFSWRDGTGEMLILVEHIFVLSHKNTVTLLYRNFVDFHQSLDFDC